MSKKNKREENTSKSIGEIVFTNVFTLFNIVNIALAVCVALVHSYKNMMFLGVAFWNTFIGMYQQIRAKRVLDKLSFLSQGKVHVIRNGQEMEIYREDMTKEDVMILSSGTQICNDGELIEGRCQVNESLLTGESDWILKKTGDKVYSGSYVVSGYGKAAVVHLGEENYIHTIARAAKKERKINSEILFSVKFVIKIVTILLFPMAVLSFGKQYLLLEQPIKEAVVSTVAAVIGMIPSGFVLLTSIVMAVGALRLATKNTLVQDMYCIETLARADVLCLDKTGTLTEGHLQVEECLSWEDFDREEIRLFCMSMQDKNATLRAIYHKYKNIEEQEEYNPSSYQVEFSSERKWSMAVLEGKGTYVLGAYEMIFPSKQEDKIKKRIRQEEERGKRVVAFAHSTSCRHEDVLPEKLTLRCLFVLGDIIRGEARETLEFFRENDVDIRIISGDNPVTVSQIARECGMENCAKYVDMSICENEEQMKKILEEYKIYGRVTPFQKQQIIRLLKEQGHTVAMTGDGVNDVLALKEADCSIAMQAGSEAARNVSHLVLLDSEFKSMPDIVMEGRRSIQNLQRSATLYLVKTVYSIMIAIFFLFVPFPYPFQPVQLTLIGALSIGIPSFLLALEKNYGRVKGNFLRHILGRAIPGGILVFLNILASLGFTMLFGYSEAARETTVFLSTAAASMIVLFYLCIPFTFMRTILFGGITSVLVACIVLFGGLFEVVKVPWITGLLLAALISADLLFYKKQ